jgi:hypothetical protein
MSDKERFSVKDPVSAAFKSGSVASRLHYVYVEPDQCIRSPVDVWSEHLTDLPDLHSGPSATEADDRLEAVNLLFSLLGDGKWSRKACTFHEACSSP